MKRSKSSTGSFLVKGNILIGYWYEYVTVNGVEIRKRVKKSIGPATMNRKEAQAKLIRFIDGIEPSTPEPTQPSKPAEVVPAAQSDKYTFAMLWTRYTADKAGDWGKMQKESLASMFRLHVLPVVGTRDITDLTASTFKGILNGLVAEGKSKSLVEHIRKNAIACFNWAVDERIQGKQGRIEHNPLHRLKCPEQAIGYQKKYFTPAQVQALHAVMDDDSKLMLELLAMGLRPQELIALKPNDIDAAKSELMIDEAIKEREIAGKRIGRTKTEGSATTVPIAQAITAKLIERIQVQSLSADEFIFHAERTTKKPLRINNYRRRVFKPFCQQVGLGWGDLRTLRRTCATYLDSVEVAARQLRHSEGLRGTTHKHYRAYLDTHHREAVERLYSRLFLETQEAN